MPSPTLASATQFYDRLHAEEPEAWARAKTLIALEKQGHVKACQAMGLVRMAHKKHMQEVHNETPRFPIFQGPNAAAAISGMRGTRTGIMTSGAMSRRTGKATPLPTQVPTGNRSVIVREGLNLRSSPGGMVLARIPFRSRVMAVSANNGWSSVSWNGKRGYAMTQFLSPPEALSPHQLAAISGSGDGSCPADGRPQFGYYPFPSGCTAGVCFTPDGQPTPCNKTSQSSNIGVEMVYLAPVRIAQLRTYIRAAMAPPSAVAPTSHVVNQAILQTQQAIANVQAAPTVENIKIAQAAALRQQAKTLMLALPSMPPAQQPVIRAQAMAMLNQAAGLDGQPVTAGSWRGHVPQALGGKPNLMSLVQDAFEIVYDASPKDVQAVLSNRKLFNAQVQALVKMANLGRVSSMLAQPAAAAQAVANGTIVKVKAVPGGVATPISPAAVAAGLYSSTMTGHKFPWSKCLPSDVHPARTSGFDSSQKTQTYGNLVDISGDPQINKRHY